MKPILFACLLLHFFQSKYATSEQEVHIIRIVHQDERYEEFKHKHVDFDFEPFYLDTDEFMDDDCCLQDYSSCFEHEDLP